MTRQNGGLRMANQLSVLVTGATGNQGGALARVLLSKGHHVRAVTRNPDSPAAQDWSVLSAQPAV